MGLLGNAEAEGAAREGRAASGGEEEDKNIAKSYHDTVLYDKLRKVVCQATDREVGGCIILDEHYTNTGQPVAEDYWRIT